MPRQVRRPFAVAATVAAVVVVVAVVVASILRRKPQVVAEGGDTQAIFEAYVRQWSKALGIDQEWMRAHLDLVEDEAYDAGAPTDWESRGWPTPVGPWDDRYRFEGPSLKSR
jgi:hypothetical protein